MLKFAVKKSAENIFHDAVANKDVSRLRFLLQNMQRGFNIDELDGDGLTALQRSCFIGNLQLVQLLVTYGANIDIQDREGWTVLHASAVAGNSSILRFLVRTGANVTAHNDLGELPIDLANDLDCVTILAEAMLSAGYGELIDSYFAKKPSMKRLIEKRLRESSNKTLSTESSYDKSMESQKESIAMNSTKGGEPLGNLSKTHSYNGEGLQIIERERQPEGGRALGNNSAVSKHAICQKCQGKKRFSNASSCSVSSDSSNSSSSDSAYVSSLSLWTESLPYKSRISKKNETNLNDEHDVTPVFYSGMPKHISTPASKPHKVHHCRKHEKRDKPRSLSSPASVSMLKRHRLLTRVKERGDMNTLDESGLSLLHLLARKGDTDRMKILLENGAEVNRQALDGNTPLHEASQSGTLDSILMLLDFEADLFAENDDGLLPIDIAKNKEAKLLLHKAMAMK